MERADDSRRTALEDIDHIAHSPNRAKVIRLFSVDDWTRRDLHEETDIPQSTLGRILGSFQDRNWIRRNGDTYSLTLHGRLVATHFQDLLAVVESVRELPASATFEPILELGFDPDWLTRVSVTNPAATDDPFAHIRRIRDEVRSAPRIRELAPRPMPGVAELMSDRLRSDRTVLETVFPSDVFQAFVAETDNRSLIVGMLDTGNFRLYLLDDSISCYVSRYGEQAVFDVQSTDGRMIALLTTDDRTIIQWADSVIDEHQHRAERVETSDLAY
jgi:predicted transcriptional regulator